VIVDQFWRCRGLLQVRREPLETFTRSIVLGLPGLVACMIGLVLVTHGRLAEEFRHAVEHVVGAQKNFETVSIGADDDMEQRRTDIVDAVARADTGTGVIILTDMFGGTPSNLAISVMSSGKIEVIAGVNLPMLIKLTSVRANDDMAAALQEGQMAGRKYINVASQLLSGK
jgi:PTS system mannose-specific IIA component